MQRSDIMVETPSQPIGSGGGEDPNKKPPYNPNQPTSLPLLPLDEMQSSYLISLFLGLVSGNLNKNEIVIAIWKQLCETVGHQAKRADDPFIAYDILAILKVVYENLTLQKPPKVENIGLDLMNQIRLLLESAVAMLQRRIVLVSKNQRSSPGGHFFELVEEYRVSNCSRLFAGVLLLIDLRDAYRDFSGDDCYVNYLLPWDPNATLEEKEILTYQSFELNPAQRQAAKLQPFLCSRDDFFREQFQLSLEFRKKLTSKEPPGDSLVLVVAELDRSIKNIIFKVSKKPAEPKPFFIAYVEACIALLKQEIIKANHVPVGKTLTALLAEYRGIYGDITTQLGNLNINDMSPKQ